MESSKDTSSERKASQREHDDETEEEHEGSEFTISEERLETFMNVYAEDLKPSLDEKSPPESESSREEDGTSDFTITAKAILSHQEILRELDQFHGVGLKFLMLSINNIEDANLVRQVLRYAGYTLAEKERKGKEESKDCWS
ncbi:unnamed protein product [Hymenolepis diminuta]|uniref:STAS domain-containing protein n=1 Tax=Hymenolepis diminuta TaxID=6216 RepID=A0A158QDY1_HYMDI|nr:unnamed protein product [Hymenolepis diminuta]